MKEGRKEIWYHMRHWGGGGQWRTRVANIVCVNLFCNFLIKKNATSLKKKCQVIVPLTT